MVRWPRARSSRPWPGGPPAGPAVADGPLRNRRRWSGHRATLRKPDTRVTFRGPCGCGAGRIRSDAPVRSETVRGEQRGREQFRRRGRRAEAGVPAAHPHDVRALRGRVGRLQPDAPRRHDRHPGRQPVGVRSRHALDGARGASSRTGSVPEAVRVLKVRFAKQVWPGDVLTCVATVTGTRDENGETLVDLDLAVDQPERRPRDHRFRDRRRVVAPTMGLLDGRVAIVTGSGRGIGREFALVLRVRRARRRERRRCLARRPRNRRRSRRAGVPRRSRSSAARRCPTTTRSPTSTAPGASSRPRSTRSAPIDILVNNAGIVRDRTLVKMDESDFDSVIAVHLKGSFNCARHAAPIMKDRNYGRIVNITSSAGLRGNFGQTNYGAAKAGIMGMTFVWALELGRYGITVNAVAPSGATRMTAALFERTGEAPPPEENPALNAPLVAFLASEAAGHVNGQILGRTEFGYAVPAAEADRVDVEGRRVHARRGRRQLRPHPRPAPPAGRDGDAEVDGAQERLSVPFPFGLGVVDVVYAVAWHHRGTGAARAADGFAHIDPMVGTDPARSRCRSGARPRSRGPRRDGAPRPRRPTARPVGEDRRALPRRARLPDGAVGRLGRRLDRAGARDARRGARSRAARRHRPRRRLGRRPARAAAVRAARAAAPGHAGLDPTPCRRPRGVVDFAAVVARLQRLGYDGRCSVEYFDLPEQGWALADPAPGPVDLAAPLRG